MLLILILAILFSIFYAGVITACRNNWIHNISIEETPFVALPNISIIVIARNEERHIEECLSSITNNDYPINQYEIILIDDHSTDRTSELASKLGIDNLRVLHLCDYDCSSFGKAYKKAGQYYAIQEAKHELILQTDADCVCPKYWIGNMSEALSSASLVTGPINITGDNSFLSRWQTFENMGTMAATHAGISKKLWFSANAANMAYAKGLYNQYAQNISRTEASGDDLFLINWMHQQGHKVNYLKSKDAIVETGGQESLTSLYRQRLRWATKTKGYDQSGIKFLMGAIFLFHLFIIVCVAGAIAGNNTSFYCAFILYIVKWIADLFLLRNVAPFFGDKYSFARSPFFSLAHSLYIVFIGFCGLLFKDYSWKGRTVR